MDISTGAALVSAIIAVCATILSVIVMRQTERISRQANYTRLHEMLVDPKAACGRRKLFMAYDHDAYPTLGDPDWDDINYSLALYDTLGGYLKHGLIDRELALAAWHDPLTRITTPAEHFICLRARGLEPPPWAFLRYLLQEADAYSISKHRSVRTPTRKK